MSSNSFCTDMALDYQHSIEILDGTLELWIEPRQGISVSAVDVLKRFTDAEACFLKLRPLLASIGPEQRTLIRSLLQSHLDSLSKLAAARPNLISGRIQSLRSSLKKALSEVPAEGAVEIDLLPASLRPAAKHYLAALMSLDETVTEHYWAPDLAIKHATDAATAFLAAMAGDVNLKAEELNVVRMIALRHRSMCRNLVNKSRAADRDGQDWNDVLQLAIQGESVAERVLQSL
jgi:hypothetical protein